MRAGRVPRMAHRRHLERLLYNAIVSRAYYIHTHAHTHARTHVQLFYNDSGTALYT